MAGFDQDDSQERLAHEAEDLMRQRRYGDAAARYQDLLTKEPTDLWIRLGWISALECAGLLDDARTKLEETDRQHRRSAPFQRFRHLFFVRREDFAAAAASQRALRSEVIDDGPDDQLADLYFNQGRYLEARSELERLLAQGIEDTTMRASATARLGACLRQTGDLDGARTRLLEALELEPNSHWTLTELAEVERARGDTAAARARYHEALAADADDHWAKGHLAQLEFEDGNADKALELYGEIVAKLPNAAWPLVEMAQVLTEKDPAKAMALARQALDLDPKNPWGHAQLGTLARRAGRPEEARDHYQRALEGSPGALWILHELADTCRQLGRIEDGYAHLRRALEEDAYNAVTHGYMADFLRHEGKPEAALPHLAKAVDIDPDYAWGWRELAEIHALGGRHDEAEKAYLKVRELDGDAAIADGLKAFLLRCQNRREAALPWLERATDKQADYVWAWRERVETLLGLDRVAEAAAVADQAVRHLPDVGNLHALRAEALRRAGRREDAMEAAGRAITLVPDAPQPWAIRAELLLGQNDPRGAEAAARQAVHLAGPAPEYRVLLAQILTTGGRESEAREIIATVLNGPNAPAPAYELAAHLAERAGDRDAALAWCQSGLAATRKADATHRMDNDHSHAARLAVRQARLAGRNPGGEFAPVFASREHVGVPWREIAGLFAQAEQPIEARRAAYRGIEEAADTTALVRAWLTLGEAELSLGQPAAAQTALDRALVLDGDHLQARLLGALLAEGRGERTNALGHLRHLEACLERRPAGDDQGLTEPLLALQLALLYERSEDLAAARRIFRKLMAGSSQDLPALAGQYGCFLARRGTVADAAEATQVAERHLGAHPGLRRRLWREMAIALGEQDGAATGLRELLRHEDDFDDDLRHLAARLALSAGEPATTLRVLGTLDGPIATPLRIRALLGSGDNDAALRRAIAWHQERPKDEEATTLHGECLAGRGQFAEAYALLTHADLPARPAAERGFLTALLALELHGPAWCQAVLAKIGPPDHDIPLVRVLAAAWQGAWTAPDPARPATPADMLTVPPFPQVCRHLSEALLGAGRADLAAPYLTAALHFHAVHRPKTWRAWRLVGDLRRRTCRALAANGQRSQALALAVRAFDLPSLLAACRP